jgi:predicted DNA-binding antitoxin AbrB/MazE fold protein
MIIRAKYEDGVFKPLEDAKLTEGTLVKISVPLEDPPKRPKSVRELPILGMWPTAMTFPTA